VAGDALFEEKSSAGRDALTVARSGDRRIRVASVVHQRDSRRCQAASTIEERG
jgi:hypothetical protein